MKKLLTILILAAAASVAVAGNENANPCGNNGNNCNVGGGQGGDGGNGGAGGQGGIGGNATGGTGYGGAGGSAVNGPNTNTQGQVQSQDQGQEQSIKNSGNSSSASGVKNSGNLSSNSGGNTQSNAGNNATTSVTVGGDTVTHAAQEKNPVNTAYAASIAPTAVCALSMSGGAQGSFFGFSIGGSYIDKNCEHLEQVRAANSIGQKEIAAEMMMDIPAFAAASKRLADRKAL